MAKRKSIIPGFSLNRALGITSAKQKIARATGIPTTKQGRKRKLQSSLWTAVAFGVAASAASSPSSEAVSPDEAARCEKARADGRRARKIVILVALALCLGCFLFVRVIPELLYLLGF